MDAMVPVVAVLLVCTVTRVYGKRTTQPRVSPIAPPIVQIMNAVMMAVAAPVEVVRRMKVVQEGNA
jgi:hypothetical protein